MAVKEEWDWIERTCKGLDPLDVFRLREAVIQEHNQFVTEANRTFHITYLPDGETIRYRPADGGFVPMGFVSIRELIREDVL